MRAAGSAASSSASSGFAWCFKEDWDPNVWLQPLPVQGARQAGKERKVPTMEEFTAAAVPTMRPESPRAVLGLY